MIKLRILKVDDVNKDYLRWMNDFKLHEFTEQKYKKKTINTLKKFVKSKMKTNLEFLYGIFYKNKHIGNIKLGPIHPIHKYAEISYFIGEKKFHNKGIATETISKIINIAKKKKLKKLIAGCHEINKSSIKVLEKNNFKIEGSFKNMLLYKNKRYKSLWLGIEI